MMDRDDATKLAVNGERAIDPRADSGSFGIRAQTIGELGGNFLGGVIDNQWGLRSEEILAQPALIFHIISAAALRSRRDIFPFGR